MAGENGTSGKETGVNNVFLIRFENATNAVPQATNRLRGLYQIRSQHPPFNDLRRELYSEGRLYGEKVHPQSLALVETIRYITATMHEAAHLPFNQLLTKLHLACQQAEREGKKLSLKYTIVMDRLESLKARMKSNRNGLLHKVDLSNNDAVLDDERAQLLSNSPACSNLISVDQSCSSLPDRHGKPAERRSSFTRPGSPLESKRLVDPSAEKIANQLQLMPQQATPEANGKKDAIPNSPNGKRTQDGWRRRLPTKLPNVKARLLINSPQEPITKEADEIGVLGSAFEDLFAAIQSMSELVQSMWGFASKVRYELDCQTFPRKPIGNNGQREIPNYSEVIGTGKFVIEGCEKLRAARMNIWQNMYAIEDTISDNYRKEWDENMEKRIQELSRTSQ